MAMSADGASGDSGNAVKLVLAWAFVGVPLLWGVWNTLMAALQLFK
ncbi:MAG TPA: hypothetical protein VKU03_13535 [Roseiarcus sp.]|nr:hypothetical protein [Roseiarcus sp.]